VKKDFKIKFVDFEMSNIKMIVHFTECLRFLVKSFTAASLLETLITN